jgi:1,4-alpha-glucan branching enzyme
VQKVTKTLNHLYKTEPALHAKCSDPTGFEWINIDDWQNSVMCFLRKSDVPEETILVVLNFTPVERTGYRVGIPNSKKWEQIFNSQSIEYWGSGHHGTNEITVESEPSHGKENSVVMEIPPIAAIMYKHVGPLPKVQKKKSRKSAAAKPKIKKV